jgi:hypothetical protein
MPTIPSILETALRYHAQGLPVVPCVGKRPIGKGWHKERRSREELMAELAANERLNIALVLNQSPWIDVECDSPEAEEALLKMCGGKIPETPTWESARGKHRLFEETPGLPDKAKVDIDGVEVRLGNGKGAASVLPPSVHPKTGKRYRWVDGLSLDEVKPAELPSEIVERLKSAGGKPSTESTVADRIREGERNDTLFGKALALKKAGIPEAELADVLLALNEKLCDPPLPESEVSTIAESAAKGDGKDKDDFVSQLLDEVELWQNENDEPYVTVLQGEHSENWPISDKPKSQFGRWLSCRYYDTTGKVLGSGGLTNYATLLSGKAQSDGPRHYVYRRVAEHDSKFYVDLCDPERRVVEVDADGWRIVSNPPVKFRRARAMHPLPMPVQTSGRDLKELLLPFLNVRPEQWANIAAWMVAALRPRGPYPVLKLLGEQGSAKTTTARVLRKLVDPNAAPVRAEPRKERDMMISADNGWVICLDNLSSLKPWLSDGFCRLSTGGGFATRELYSDGDEKIFDAMRPVILTSIEEIGARSDLLERSLIVDLPSIPDKKRRPEKQLWADFEKAWPHLLGALLDVVSGAIRRLPEIEQREDPELPRLADFFVWGQAAEEPLGLPEGAFAEAFAANREAATQTVLESSPAICALLRYLSEHPGEHEKTALEWLEALKRAVADTTYQPEKQPGWPKTPRVLSAILKRTMPNLRQVGIVAVPDTVGGGNDKRKVWRIHRPADPTHDDPAPDSKPEPGSQGRKGSRIPRTLEEVIRNATTT